MTRRAPVPDEIWATILDTGIKTSDLNYKDIFSFSYCCKDFNNIANLDFIWSTLLTLDFPGRTELPSSSSGKSLYRETFEKCRDLSDELDNIENQIDLLLDTDLDRDPSKHLVSFMNLRQKFKDVVKEAERMGCNNSRLKNLSSLQDNAV